ncbi:MAG: sulfotransferase [Myxococcota bacterium]|nr:sulfotransferase [Myxococcota bacterium]
MAKPRPDLDALQAEARNAPGDAEVWTRFATALAAAGDHADAADAWDRVSTLLPADVRPRYNGTMARHRAGQRAEARAEMATLSEMFPSATAVWNTLGTLHMEAGAVVEAEAAFSHALRLQPDHAQARANLAAARSYRGDTAGATRSLLEAFKQRPQDTSIQVQLGNTLIQTGNLETAAKMFRRALRLEPMNLDAAAGLATVWERQQRAQDARALLEPLVTAGHRAPNLLAAWGLACRRTGELEAPIPVLEEALTGPLPAGARFTLGHVLGDLHDKRGDTAGAMRCHGYANSADGRTHEPAHHCRIVDQTLIRATRDKVQGWARARSLPGPRMVFIVGMPRSGTSLTEQIIGTHPAVHPAGEREELPRLVESLVRRLAPGGSWLDAAERLGADALTDAAAWYRARVCDGAGSADVVTDKMPLNYRYLALVSRMFPEARFVHTQRAPLDTALSCYFASFNFAYAFTNKLSWLGYWIRDHDRLLNHWQSELDAPLLVSPYERLVEDLEGRVRVLLDFLDLPWHEACLAFHETDRAVNTASYAQVRRPLYASSIGRARPYKPFLEPLISAMTEAP